jgi:hypothetical protein
MNMDTVRKNVDYVLMIGYGLILFGVLGMAWVFGLI